MKTNLLVAALAITAMLVISPINSFSQDGEEDQESSSRRYTNAIVIQGERVFTQEIAHSNTDYGLMIGRIGIETWFDTWWSLRFEVEPVIYAFSDERENQTGMGFAVVWNAYFQDIGSLEPFFSAELGAASWEADFPTPASNDVNFTIAFSGGFTYKLDERNGIQFGARFWHLSNNNFGYRNPGINGPSIFVGYRWMY